MIKDAINFDIFKETYDSLNCTDASVISDAVLVEDNPEDVSEVVQDDTKFREIVDIDYKKRVIEFWRSGQKKRRNIESVKNRFKKVINVTQLYRWEAQVAEGGSRTDKLLYISQYVLEQFNSASDRNLSIHDLDLKRWALKAREVVHLPSQLFTASSKWIHNFKIQHGIVSRKINKFVTQAHILNKAELLEQSSNYVSQVKLEIGLLGTANVYNSDQSGFNLETHAGRTLASKGSLKVECLAQSLNSLTHSYTIQPLISADGILKSPLLIVLQETSGRFGPIIQKSMYKADNILVFATKSGKLTSDIVIKWFKNVFLPNGGKKSILCLDSWSGQTEKKFENIDKGNKEVKILTIPTGTTGFTQPLDVYVFRPWKNFLKKFSDLILLYNYDINLHLRNNILKIQSLIHNQFSSPRFQNMIKYAWWKSGYIEEKPDRCETPVDFCLKNCGTVCKICNNIAVIKCAWCTNSLCMEHFFAKEDKAIPHYCHEYKE